MFCFKAGVFLEELKEYAQQIYTASKKAFDNANSNNLLCIYHDDMAAIPEESIDYAVLGKSSNVKLIPTIKNISLCFQNQV